MMDPGKALRRQKMAIVETSCDESESGLEQKMDDDKMELMCHEGVVDYLDFNLSRIGQIRSPYRVELQEEFEAQGRSVLLGIDGEYFEIRKCKKMVFQIDPLVPKLYILRRDPSRAPKVDQTPKDVLEELKEFKPTMF